MQWASACVEGLDARRDEINLLNVFPIADSDTGTNLHFTMKAAFDAASLALNTPDVSVHDLAVALARGAVAGARGNSGVILSQVLRGVADAAAHGPIDGRVYQNALSGALELVGRSMSNVVEGTVVTVLRGAAWAAAAASDGDLPVVARAAADGAAEALETTPSQLAVLRQAGVVDAGGLGLLIILDAMVGVVSGDIPTRPSYAARAATPGNLPVDDEGAQNSQDVMACVTEHVHEYSAGGVEYEIMYLLRGCGDDGATQLRDKLSDLGDSVIVVGDGSGVWSVHVHSMDPGASVEAGLAVGVPYDIRITAFGADQPGFSPSSKPRIRTVLAIVNGDKCAELFHSEGASVLRCGGECTPQDLLDAVLAVRADEIFVLPNGFIRPEELVAVSTQARQLGHPAVLLPTSSLVQGLAALAVHDPTRAASDDSYAMAAAAAGTRWGSVRQAHERALTLAGTCESGDFLALVGREVLVIDDEFKRSALKLVDLMLGAGGELVTVLTGDSHLVADFDRVVEEHIDRNHPGVEVMMYSGGQSEDIIQIGVE
ncbi:DAK2 domain-containing protein [Hoyosella rhizosphaerae]|nr:DAK2 domain-containing protein [Hoyosella rhizosphaerae]